MLSAPTTALPQTRQGEPTPSQLKAITLTRSRNYLTKAKVNLRKAQEAYRTNFDKAICIGTPIALGDEVYLDRPPKYAVTERDKTYSKLLPRKLGPFRVLKVFPNTVIIDYNGLKETVSMDRISKAPTSVAPRTLASSKEITADPTTEELLPTLPRYG